MLNDVLFRYHQRENRTTRDNLEYVLARQSTKHWRLGDCDFTRYFHYKWENENGLLGALFSIAEPFDIPYVWTWDTQTYPWTLNLKAPDNTPAAEIRYGKNLAEIERTIDPSNIVNRLYPLGYGEGDNQLDIKRVNGGLEYIENSASIAEYGLNQYVWVDRRFEDDASLLASAKAFLAEWSIPKVSYSIKAVELARLTGLTIDRLSVGKVVRIIDPDVGTFVARIVSESKSEMVEAPYDIDLEITNTRSNIGTTLADIERRQEINEVYSQGATNMLIYPYEDNADNEHPAIIRFKLPDEMVRINKLELTYETSEFRAYSRAIEGGGAVISSTKGGGAIVKATKGGGGTTRSTTDGGGTTRSTTSGGGATPTSSSGGGVAKSTASGGGTSQSSAAGGDHRHMVFSHSGGIGAPTDGYQLFYAPRNSNGTAAGALIISGAAGDVYTQGSSGNHTHSVTIPSHTHSFDIPNHTHTVTVPSHSHEVTIPAHSHNVTIPDHTHDIELPNHTHEIELPDHTHEIEHGIFKLNRTPSAVTIKVDGTVVPITATSGDSINLIPYLSMDSENRVQRGWHTVEITPNDFGRINAQLMVQFFMQSRGGVDV